MTMGRSLCKTAGMWLTVPLPTFDNGEAVGRLARLHATIGRRLEPGDVLADVTIDLSAGVARDCPPVTTCRIVMREAAWLREVLISKEHQALGGMPIALLSTDPASPTEPPARQARTTVAAIVHHEDWWATPE
jgi:hypothetical protein